MLCMLRPCRKQKDCISSCTGNVSVHKIANNAGDSLCARAHIYAVPVKLFGHLFKHQLIHLHAKCVPALSPAPHPTVFYLSANVLTRSEGALRSLPSGPILFYLRGKKRYTKVSFLDNHSTDEIFRTCWNSTAYSAVDVILEAVILSIPQNNSITILLVQQLLNCPVVYRASFWLWMYPGQVTFCRVMTSN